MPARARFVPTALAALASSLAVLALAGCPTPQSPKGPPPEYEEPPAPSWLLEGGADGGAAVADAADAG